MVLEVCKTSGSLGTKVASVIPMGPLGFGVPAWLLKFLVWQSSSTVNFAANAMDCDMELRNFGAVGGCWVSFRQC